MKRTVLAALLAAVTPLDVAIVIFLVGALLSELQRAAHTDRGMLAFIVAMLVLAVGLFVAAISLAMRRRGE
jgi:hypothetical protein